MRLDTENDFSIGRIGPTVMSAPSEARNYWYEKQMAGLQTLKTVRQDWLLPIMKGHLAETDF